VPAREAVFIDHPSFSAAAWHGLHPLAFSRQANVKALAGMMDWLSPGAIRQAQLPSRESLLRFHEPDYVDALEAAVEAGQVPREMRERYGFGTMENPIFPGLFTRASATVGGSIAAAEAALEGKLAFHPAGGTHHGKPGRASGFCYFNDPAFAIQRLLEAGAGPLLYLDLDAHHGDGVELLFAGYPDVFTLSLHEEGRWPHSGGPGEAGPPNAMNIAVPRGLNDSELDWLFDGPIAEQAMRVKPGSLVVTAGADCLLGDPLSAMALSNHALWRAVLRAAEWADHVVVLGGGGYNPWTVTRGWAGLWACLAGKDVEAPLVAEAAEMLASFECDLVDSDEIDPLWLSAIADAPNEGSVRDLVKQRAAAALRVPAGR
jgi:acetoin utilization protein AcuC